MFLLRYTIISWHRNTICRSYALKVALSSIIKNVFLIMLVSRLRFCGMYTTIFSFKSIHVYKYIPLFIPCHCRYFAMVHGKGLGFVFFAMFQYYVIQYMTDKITHDNICMLIMNHIMNHIWVKLNKSSSTNNTNR